MIDTDHPELVEFEGETLGDTLTNLITEVNRLHKNKSNLFTAIEQKLNEKGDEGLAIWEAYPDGHYKEDQLRGWCEALEFVLSLMKAQEREE